MKRKVDVTESSGNVFLDLGFPEPEARNLQLRSELMGALRAFVTQVLAHPKIFLIGGEHELAELGRHKP